jgi:CRP-like cAMP-binding protein
METEDLIQFLQSIYPIPAELGSSIVQIAYQGQFKKGQIMAWPGKKSDEIWYLLNGLAKEYYYEPSGKMSITGFWRENELMFIAESFFGKMPSGRYIEVIEDATVLTLDNKQALKLKFKYPEIVSLGYSILSLAKRKGDERSELLVLSAKESYIRFCEKFPWNRISVTDAASYLGLSRETLSAIRSKK